MHRNSTRKYGIVAIRSCGNVSFMVGLVRFDWRTHYLRKMQDIQLRKKDLRQDNKLALNDNIKYVTNFRL